MENSMTTRKNRRNKGISLVELAAAMALGFPLIMVTLYAVLEANMLFTIRANCDNAVRRASQLLISDYTKTGIAATAVSNGNLPAAMGFDVMTADGHYFINKSANQFTWTWDFVDKPNTVTVTVTYPTKGNNPSNLLPFPHPDPLNLKNKFTIVTSGTFSVPSLN
jgi:Tfp pilus assembly protein PilW